MCIFEIYWDFGPGGIRSVEGISISHVVDLLIPGTEDFILFYIILSDPPGETFGGKAIGGGDTLYLRMRITKAPNGFINDGNISDGANKLSGLTLSSGNYEGISRYRDFTRSGEANGRTFNA